MKIISNFKGKYFFLSNFYRAPVVYDGRSYLNNEAAFQSMKSMLPAIRNEFCFLDPSAAKRLGRKVDLRSDWEKVKDNVMKGICQAKFDQNDDLREGLIALRGCILIEGNTWGDRYWGQVNGVGQNKLGSMLMSIRDSYLVDN